MALNTEKDLAKGTQKGEGARKKVVDLRRRRNRKRKAQIYRNTLKMIMMHYLDIRGKRQMPENAMNFEKCNITRAYSLREKVWTIITSSLNMLNI